MERDRARWSWVVDYEQLDDVTLFLVAPSGRTTQQRSGDSIPAKEWPRRHVSPAFPIVLSAGESTLFVRVQTTSPMKFPVTLWTEQAFEAHVRVRWASLAGFYGLILGLLLHNLLLFASMRRRSQLLYSVYLAALTLFFLTYNGIAFQLMWPTATTFAGAAIPLFAAASAVFSLLFARAFLETKERAPRVDRVFRALVGVSIVGCMLIPLFDLSVAMIIGVAGLGGCSVTLLGTAGYLLARGYRPARFFVLAHAAMGLALLAALLQAEGLLPTTLLTTHGFQAAAALEAILLAAALADKINQLRVALRRSAAELEVRVDERTASLKHANSELAETLARLREQKSQREVVEDQLRQSQKMEAIGRLAGGVAHDMNNTLGAIMTSTELLQEAFDEGDERLVDVSAILGAAERGRDLTKNLLGFARKGQLVRIPLSVHDVLQQTASLLRRTIDRRIVISLELGAERCWVAGDHGQLCHAVMNLCLNAADAIEPPGSIRLVTTNEGTSIVVAVIDDGRGMDAPTRERAFEPFFTRSRDGGGTGLGLSMVYGCITDHGGKVTIESEPDMGTSVRLELATCEAHSEDPRAALPPERPRLEGCMTILIVDDEDLLRAATARMLEREGYTVAQARDGEEALDVMKQRGSSVDLVLLDLEMPKMDGSTTFREMKRLAPDVRVVLMSGHTTTNVDALLEEGATGFIAKPFARDSLDDAIATALGD